MPYGPFRLLKNALVLRPKTEVSRIGDLARGLYFLYEEDAEGYKNVVYVGKASGTVRTGIKGRIRDHSRDKSDNWTHFSAYEFWDNITEAEIDEIEALFLTAYAKDAHANKLNVQKGTKMLKQLIATTETEWKK